MAALFDIVGDITFGKKGILENDEDFKGYPQFMINRALMQNKDTVHAAAIMNRLGNIDNRMHYDFLMAMIPKRKRYGKWAKKSVPDIKFIMEHYECNEKRALEILDVLTDEQLKTVKDRVFKGGRSGKIKRKRNSKKAK